MKSQTNKTVHLFRVCLVLMICYLGLSGIFYVLMGEQLHVRASNESRALPTAQAGTTEMVPGAQVVDEFTLNLQRLNSISVQWGTFYRQNKGEVTVKLISVSTEELLLQETFDAATVEEGGLTTLVADPALEGISGLPLRLEITGNSAPGSAIVPMISTQPVEDGEKLSVNDIPVEGSLCFSADGQDYLWIGQHYWQVVGILGLCLGAYLLYAYFRWKKGLPNILVRSILALGKYNFLFRQLVSRDFKAKYKRSVLGVCWSFLNPLMTMLVQYAVFSNLFRFDIPNYPVYLLCGIILFNFFSEACGMTLVSIVGNASLITKVYVPKYIYPVTRTVSSLINFLIALIPLALVSLISGVYPTKAWLLFPFLVVCLFLFTLGVGMFLSTIMVFFRDTQFLWGIVSMVWMYLTPIFYPESILPASIAWVLRCNPLYYFVTFARTLILQGASPDPVMYVKCFVFALAALVVGAWVFRRKQDAFVLYL